jgi:hypothetical protein
LGRLHLALSAFTIALLMLDMIVLLRIDDPSLGTSLLKNTPMTLLVCTFALGLKARGDFIPRDRLALALGLITTLVGAAQGVAVDRHLGYYDALAPFELPLIGLTILALIWSAVGRK